jgi:multiple sugar transport system substrate-binding protein
MLIQSRRVTTFLRHNSTVSWDVAPLPVGTTPANLLHSDGLAMYAGSKSKEAAWTFIEFAMGPTGQTLLAESGRTVPSLEAVAESDAFLKGTSLSSSFGISVSPKNGRVFLDNIALSRRLPSEAGWASVVRGLDIELKRAFYEGAAVDETVQRIQNWTDFAFENMSTLRRRLFELQAGGPESED